MASINIHDVHDEYTINRLITRPNSGWLKTFKCTQGLQVHFIVETFVERLRSLSHDYCSGPGHSMAPDNHSRLARPWHTFLELSAAHNYTNSGTLTSPTDSAWVRMSCKLKSALSDSKRTRPLCDCSIWAQSCFQNLGLIFKCKLVPSTSWWRWWWWLFHNDLWVLVVLCLQANASVGYIVSNSRQSILIGLIFSTTAHIYSVLHSYSSRIEFIFEWWFPLSFPSSYCPRPVTIYINIQEKKFWKQKFLEQICNNINK